MQRLKLIVAFADENGTWYRGTRERLIEAGLATAAMFPEGSEVWRGNGPVRAGDEPLWAVSMACGREAIKHRAFGPGCRQCYSSSEHHAQAHGKPGLCGLCVRLVRKRSSAA